MDRLQRRDAPGALVADEDLPVVARLAIEIRSDGSRTVARGAMVDAASGTEAAIRVEAGSLVELAAKLPAVMAQAMAHTVAQAARDVGRRVAAIPLRLFRRPRAPSRTRG
ncbi:MAG: hypothetical protein K1X88_26765 [Nannocystaceae bacterium]|nr:hypothetical protein [Nannocystaceae bacterium]